MQHENYLSPSPAPSAGSGRWRPSALLFALALIVGCATVTPPPSAPASPPLPPPAPLTNSDVEKIGSILRLEDERRLDVEVLDRFLDDPRPEIRRRSTLALGRIKDPQASPLLLRALADTSALVRREAAFALGVLKDTSSSVTAELMERAWTDLPDVAVEAVAALGKLNTEAAFQGVVRILAGVGDSASAVPLRVAEEALLAVWKLPQPDRALPVIAPFVWPADAGTRWRATYATMRIGTPASVPILLPSLGDADPLVRSLAARGLRRPVVDSASASEEVRAALLESLGDRHPHVRINALGALATFAEAELAAPIARLLADPDGNVQVAAVEALRQIKGPASARAVLDAASDLEAATGVRVAALNALIELDPGLGARTASEWASSPRWLLRYHAVRAVAGLPWAEASPVLTVGARDAHALVAIAALSALGRVEDTPEAARALLVEGMRRDETTIRAAAIRAIARRAGTQDLAALLDAYERAASDSGNAAALAAVDGLVAIRNGGAPVENLFFTRFAPARDAAVRRRVIQRLGGEWPLPEEAPTVPRPDSFYRAAIQRLVAPAHRGEPAPRLIIEVREGDIVVELEPRDAPLTVLNMIELVESGYYAAGADTDRRRWHRVVPNFVLQDGDPGRDTGGGPGYAIRDEINRLRYERGMLGMALSGPDTGGGQFFITHSPQPHLDGGYTIFGRVVEGMEIADRIVQDEPILDMRIRWP